MSDAPAEGGKKKGGKLPIVIVLGGMLAAGGYFGMSSKNKGEVKEPGPELGAVVPMDPEFVVNLREREFFLRAAIAFQMDKNSKSHFGAGGKGGHGKGGPSPEEIAIRAVVNERLSSLSVNDLRRPDFYERLRRLLAEDANRVLSLLEHTEEKKDSKKKKSKDDEDEKDHGHGSKKSSMDTVVIDPEEFENPDWDSDEGPILKVYITGLATQRE